MNWYALSAKGLALTSISCTAALALLAPSSLTAVASDPSGRVGDALAIIALLLASIGWSDIIWTDVLGRTIWPSLNPQRRHQLCTALYSALGAVYAIFAFVAMDARVHSSWILIADYILIAVFVGALTVAIGTERRGPT